MYLVRDLAQPVVEDGLYVTLFHELLHGQPPRAHRVEDDHLVTRLLESLESVHGAVGEHPEIGHGDDRSPVLGALKRYRGLSHAPRARRGVGQDRASQGVETQDVTDGEHHCDVLDADE